MSFKQAWKQPLHREDVMPVLRSGIFMSISGGLIVGMLDMVFINYLQFTLTWLFLLITSHLIAKRIASSYRDYHILYSMISIFFFIFAYYIMSVTLNVGLLFVNRIPVMPYLGALLNPWAYFMFLNPLDPFFFTVDNILQIVFFIIGIVYAYRFSK
ncbi:MAG TPA: hypothetical protein PLP48_02020 [Acholeplasmataceae bacterium]|nr:hypothetical protein [Acholeplasmataceae bacterium]